MEKGIGVQHECMPMYILCIIMIIAVFILLTQLTFMHDQLIQIKYINQQFSQWCCYSTPGFRLQK